MPNAFGLLLAISVSLSAASVPIEIDHVTIAGTDLATLRKSFTAASGIQTEFGGRHANHATEMAITSFPDGSYLEFMAIQPGADAKALAEHVWSKFLQNNAGPCAFAIRVPDVKGESQILNSRGIEIKPAVQSGRTRPDGFRLEWETSDIGRGVRGTFFPFLIHDQTPREKRAYPGGKPTTTSFSGIARVVIAVNDMEDAIAEYRRVFDLRSPVREHDGKWKSDLAWFEGTPIVLAHATGNESWVALRIRRFGVGPCAVVLRAANGLAGGSISKWFGQTIFWAEDAKLGWHLGMGAY